MKGVQELANGFQDTFTNLLGSPDGFKLIGGVKSFDALRSTPVRTEGQRIFLKSYYENGNTGGGIFIGHIGTKLDDGGTVAQGVGYYWERMYQSTVSVNDFGAVGDGVTPDDVGIKYGLGWVSAKPNRKLTFDQNCLYLHNTPLTVTFKAGNTTNCEIEMLGSLYPSSSVADALTISEATYCKFKLKVYGTDYGTTSFPDYSQADPVGARQAFVINSCRGCETRVEGYGYNGRVLRTKATGTVKMSFNDISIKTGEGSCAQAAYLQGSADAFGKISHGQTQWDYFGSVLDKLTDLTIVYWEYGNKNSAVPAMLMNNCGSVEIGNLTGGSTWDSDTSTTLKIVGGQGIHASRIQVGEAYTGLSIVGGGLISDKPSVTIDNLLSYKTNQAVALNNTTGVKILSGLCDNTYYGVRYSGNINNCRVNMDGRNNFTAMHSAVTGAAIKSLSIGGDLYSETTTTFINFGSVAVNKLYVNDTNVVTTGKYLVLPTDNQCIVRGGQWSGSLDATPISGRPKHISNVQGIKTAYLNAGLQFLSGTVQGATITINHGLWAMPFEISVMPYSVASGTYPSGNIAVKTLSSTQVVLMYTGAAALTGDMYLLVNIKSEARVD
jgi:hypothetical protein